MKQTNPNTAMQIKWSLFGLLTFALGFNLSMNPEHFNNITRNYKMNELLMASTLPKVDCNLPEFRKIVLTAAELQANEAKQIESCMPKIQSTTKDGRTAIVMIGEEKKLYRYTWAELGKLATKNDHVIISLQAVDGSCTDICGVRILEKDDTKSLAEQILAATAKVAAEAEATAGSIDTETKPEAKGYPKAIAAQIKVCENSSDKLTCHKNNMIALSKALPDKADRADKVLEYYNEYVSADLKEILTAGISEALKDADSYTEASELIAEIEEQSDEAKQLLEDITESLKPINGQKVRKELAKLEKRAIDKQVREAKNLRVAAEKTLRDNKNLTAKEIFDLRMQFDLGADLFLDAQQDATYFNDMNSGYTESLTERSLRTQYTRIYNSLFNRPLKNLFKEVTIANLGKEDSGIPGLSEDGDDIVILEKDGNDRITAKRAQFSRGNNVSTRIQGQNFRPYTGNGSFNQFDNQLGTRTSMNSDNFGRTNFYNNGVPYSPGNTQYPTTGSPADFPKSPGQ
jgi:hypothetical protein